MSDVNVLEYVFIHKKGPGRNNIYNIIVIIVPVINLL